jgi:hypothetical protein
MYDLFKLSRPKTGGFQFNRGSVFSNEFSRKDTKINKYFCKNRTIRGKNGYNRHRLDHPRFIV